MADTGLTLVSCDDMHHLWPGEEGLVCEEPIENLLPPCGEKLFRRVTVRKEEYGGKYKVINCGWA